MTTPAEELRTAATKMREYPGRAADPIARLLEAAADLGTAYPDLTRDHDRATCDDYACDLIGRAIDAARAINATHT